MPRPALRSRSWRRIKKKLPGGAYIIHYLKRKPSNAKCSVCGATLHGIKKASPTKTKNLSKSKKTVSRPYGANLCSSCARKEMKSRVR